MSSRLNFIIKQKVKKYIKDNCIGNAKFGKLCGVTKLSINRWLSNESSLKLSQVEKICRGINLQFCIIDNGAVNGFINDYNNSCRNYLNTYIINTGLSYDDINKILNLNDGVVEKWFNKKEMKLAHVELICKALGLIPVFMTLDGSIFS